MSATAMTAATVATAMSAYTSTAMKAASASGMIERRVMATATPMVFPRMVNIEVATAAPPSTAPVGRVAICGVTAAVVIAAIPASTRGARDHAKQN